MGYIVTICEADQEQQFEITDAGCGCRSGKPRCKYFEKLISKLAIEQDSWEEVVTNLHRLDVVADAHST